jgi:hypothetical protein
LKQKLAGGNPVTFEDFLKIGFAVDVKVNEGGEEAKEGEGSLPYEGVKDKKVRKLVTPATKKATAPAGGKVGFRSFLKTQKD